MTVIPSILLTGAKVEPGHLPEKRGGRSGYKFDLIL